MLEAFWKGIQARGTHAQRMSKVKGHATFDNVSQGNATSEDRAGNNEPGACATMGIREATPGSMRRTVCWLLRRQALYATWLKTIDKIIVGVLRAEQGSARDEKED